MAGYRLQEIAMRLSFFRKRFIGYEGRGTRGLATTAVGLAATLSILGLHCDDSSTPVPASPGLTLPPTDGAVSESSVADGAAAPEAGVDTTVADAGVDATIADAGVDATIPEGGPDASNPDAGVDATIPEGGPDASNPDAGATPTVDAAPDAAAASDGGLCNGVCIALAEGRNTPLGVAVRNGQVYWTEDNGSGAVMTVPVDGGTPVALATGQSYPYGIVATATDVYWATYHAQIAGGTVMDAPLDGGAPVAIATNLSGPQYVTANAQGVFWNAENTGGGVLFAGGGVQTYAIAGATYLASNDTTVFWSVPPDVDSLSIASGVPATFAAGQYPEAIAVDSSYVYWVNDGDAVGITRAPLDGGAPVSLVTGLTSPTYLAVDDTNLYWTSVNGGLVMKLPLAGGPPVVLAHGQNGPWTVAVDDTSVYWTNSAEGTEDGTVMKLTPK
jgi:hypothetical protein